MAGTFTSRDLALFLPDGEGGDAYSLRHTKLDGDVDAKDLLKPKIDKSKKVHRYIKGQAPKWLQDDKGTNREKGAVLASVNHVGESASTAAAPIDRRLARLAASSTVNTSSAGVSENNDMEPPRRRRIYEAQVIVEGGEESIDRQKEEKQREWEQRMARIAEGFDDVEDDDDDNNNVICEEDKHHRMMEARDIDRKESSKVTSAEDNDDVAARRARARLIAMQRAEVEAREAEMAAKRGKAESTDDEDDDDDDEDDTSSDSSSSEEASVITKPVFVPKAMRMTIREAEAKQREEVEKQQQQLQQKEVRKQQTREMVAENIRRTEDKSAVDNTDVDSDAGLPDDTDDPNDERMEEDLWKIREIKRLKRDAEQREIAALEAADLQRRRNMTDEERRAEDEAAGRFKAKEKAKWNYLQKYYHKGVFYMDEDNVTKDDVRARDYAAPTGEDKFHREALPSVLQVKNFGKRGRTKYTHLADQDTTFGATKTATHGAFGKGERMGVGTGVRIGGFEYDVGERGGSSDVNAPANGFRNGGGAPRALLPHETIKKKMESKFAGVHGDLDSAGRLKKKSKFSN